MTAKQYTIIGHESLPITDQASNDTIPFYSSKISAGFPSPAEDHLDSHIDLKKLLVPIPSASFMLEVSGDSMNDAGIFDGDLLIIDRTRTAKDGSVVIAAVHGELTVKRLKEDIKGVWLVPDNTNYQPLFMGDGSDLMIWGCVSYAIHPL